jgi:hypothetical protein
MIRISIPFFYGLGATMRQIVGLQPGLELNVVWSSLFNAQTELQNLFASEWFFPAVKNAWQPGQKLLSAINVLTQHADFSKKLDHMETYNVTSGLAEFEAVLRNELAIADVY